MENRVNATELKKREELRAYIISHFEQALSEGWIEVYNQPIVRAANGRVSDEEALARWVDPELGMIYPMDFIPFLEDEKLVYKLDLYVAKKVLEKMSVQGSEGLYIVPESVNISRTDFFSCDIVEEMKKLVDDAGVDPDRITIEVTESVVAADLDFMKQQVERFQNYGFKVWLDDFGSGYSSPDVLQNIHFDTIKFDMQFMQRFYEGDETKIILGQLIRMALNLGIDTVVEGVETRDQMEFLKDVGCTKLQGFFYCKPIPLAGIIERNKKGIQIGFENPDESGYYEAIGRVNLYDAAASMQDDEEALQDFFNTAPMAIFESDSWEVWLVRMNESFRKLHSKIFPGVREKDKVNITSDVFEIRKNLVEEMLSCGINRRQSFMDLKLEDGSVAHIYLRRVAVKPTTGVFALVFIVLGVISADVENQKLTYSDVAKALATDYIFFYYVDLDTGKFIEYSSVDNYENLTIERHGDDFFGETQVEATKRLYGEDVDQFLRAFTKENVQNAIKEYGVFTTTYRLMIDDVPQYMHMKVMPIKNRGNKIIICVSNIDIQQKRQESYDQMKSERLTYSRIAAIAGDFISIYTINPMTDEFVKYAANQDFKGINLPSQGENFFNKFHILCDKVLYSEDREEFLNNFTKKKILSEIEKNGTYSFDFRSVNDSKPVYISVRAALVDEKEGKRLVVGFVNIDKQVKQYQEYVKNLSHAQEVASIDELTGVRNKRSYVQMEEQLNISIEAGLDVQFAIVVLDINGLKEVNDVYGHQAGDQYIKDGCKIICDIFRHSPVYRIGGDEFVAVIQGKDYEIVEQLMGVLADINHRNFHDNKVVLAGGMARYEDDKNCAAVFRRADQLMYANKMHLKKHMKK